MLAGVAHLGRSLALGLSLGAAALACGRADPSWQRLAVAVEPGPPVPRSNGGVRLPDDLCAAYDLERDRAERENVAPAATWVDELVRLAAPAWAALQEPVVPVPRVELDESEAAELRQVGY